MLPEIATAIKGRLGSTYSINKATAKYIRRVNIIKPNLIKKLLNLLIVNLPTLFYAS